jgi:hypothetical protein
MKTRGHRHCPLPDAVFGGCGPASTKHFRSTYEHFTEYAAMASDLFLNTEDSAQRNTLGLLAAAASYQPKGLF